MLEFVGVNELIGKNIFEQFELFNRNDFRIHFDLPLESDASKGDDYSK